MLFGLHACNYFSFLHFYIEFRIVNKLNTIVFEDGQGKLMDEDSNELMEVDEMVVEVKGLTSLSDYLQTQLRHSIVTIEDGVKDENNTGNTTKITKTKKKAYTVYSDIDKYNFILTHDSKVSKEGGTSSKKVQYKFTHWSAMVE